MSLDPATLWQYVIPQRLVCSVVYRAARSRSGWLARPLINWFARTYRLDLTEAEHGSPDDYESLNALFTRRLRPDARPVNDAPDAFVSPADGRLTRIGRIERGALLQAKGISYSLAELIGEADTGRYEGGESATIYLAPHNYHRVHVPAAGRLVRTRYIPGDRFSVNTRTARSVPRLFARNERAVMTIETGRFSYLLVMVGALNVSSISTASHGELPSGRAACWTEAPEPRYATGAELGTFNLGSTVILVAPPGAIRWDSALSESADVRMGELLGRIVAPGHGA